MYKHRYIYIYIYIYIKVRLPSEAPHVAVEVHGVLFFPHAISLTRKHIGAGSGRVYSGRCRQPPRLAQISLVR